MIPLLVSEIVVATIAMMAAALALWIGAARRSRENAWAAAVCVGTGAYAGLQFLYCQATTAAAAIAFQKSEDVALGVLGLAVFEYGSARGTSARKWPPRVVRTLAALAGRMVLMTGGLPTADARRFAREHPDQVVHKPLERADLARLLERFAPAATRQGRTRRVGSAAPAPP